MFHKKIPHLVLPTETGPRQSLFDDALIIKEKKAESKRTGQIGRRIRKDGPHGPEREETVQRAASGTASKKEIHFTHPAGCDRIEGNSQAS
ncbi:MAG: hypothetical protein IJU20_07105 [Clostridia bacterium]|nr:hypothetical protein [Clostridia bacterium]